MCCVCSVSLEDLYTGATKKLKISRLRKGQKDEKVVEVTIKKGWKPGTKITFPGEGDEEASGAEPADIQFVIAEKPHPRFRRDGALLVPCTKSRLFASCVIAWLRC